jgi:hypothetical protein
LKNMDGFMKKNWREMSSLISELYEAEVKTWHSILHHSFRSMSVTVYTQSVAEKGSTFQHLKPIICLGGIMSKWKKKKFEGSLNAHAHNCNGQNHTPGEFWIEDYEMMPIGSTV